MPLLLLILFIFINICIITTTNTAILHLYVELSFGYCVFSFLPAEFEFLYSRYSRPSHISQTLNGIVSNIHTFLLMFLIIFTNALHKTLYWEDEENPNLSAPCSFMFHSFHSESTTHKYQISKVLCQLIQSEVLQIAGVRQGNKIG